MIHSIGEFFSGLFGLSILLSYLALFIKLYIDLYQKNKNQRKSDTSEQFKTDFKIPNNLSNPNNHMQNQNPADPASYHYNDNNPNHLRNRHV